MNIVQRLVKMSVIFFRGEKFKYPPDCYDVIIIIFLKKIDIY